MVDRDWRRGPDAALAASAANEEFLRSLFYSAIDAADPLHTIGRHLPKRPKGRTLVVGAGKAAARMAEAVEAHWGDCQGLVVTRYGHSRPCRFIEVAEAAHPHPDEAGLNATKRMLATMQHLGPDDLVLALISGGASSLLVAPQEGVTLKDKQEITRMLLQSGAPIQAINTVRKSLSRVKGGRLAAAAYPARVVTLLMSDVPGDEPELIGSGPTVGSTRTSEDALRILRSHKVPIRTGVERALASGMKNIHAADSRLARTENHIITAPSLSLAAAASQARAAGCKVIDLGTTVEGEACEVANKQAKQALSLKACRQPGDAPVILLSGGELTVTQCDGTGVGGPNAEFCLALAIALDGAAGISAIACDTDGIDGAADVAGAVIGHDTLQRARRAGLCPAAALSNKDAHSFFAAIDSQVVTGPTLTNVNDFRAILIA